MDLVWIVLSCQATQAERPDSLTQSKPNPHMVLLHSAQHFWFGLPFGSPNLTPRLLTDDDDDDDGI